MELITPRVRTRHLFCTCCSGLQGQHTCAHPANHPSACDGGLEDRDVLRQFGLEYTAKGTVEGQLLVTGSSLRLYANQPELFYCSLLLLSRAMTTTSTRTRPANNQQWRRVATQASGAGLLISEVIGRNCYSIWNPTRAAHNGTATHCPLTTMHGAISRWKSPPRCPGAVQSATSCEATRSARSISNT